MADQPQIKPDPDAPSTPFMDEADENPPIKMYLARLPAYVWEAWSNLDDDAEIEIGTIRQYTDKDGQVKLQMNLRSDIKQHAEVPKEYNMEVMNHEVNNTFVFTEQDLPSFAAKNKVRAEALAQGIPAHLLRKQQKQMEPPQERGRNRAPYARRPIPKKTKIAGKIKHEVVCTPVHNAESDRFLHIRAEPSHQGQRTTKMYNRLPAQGMANNEWESFLKTKEKPTKAKKMENKATRWPENQLLDEIAKCFSKHNPRPTCANASKKIAVLNRTGVYANQWSLKPEYEGMLASLPKPADDAAVASNAPLDEEDDEDIKMEDVL
ncbi:hypothetical protein N0V88_006637 [Collariella sp. IMI 366227]|nr:hypothetical protein N0V88_006637 [Collariella sp. IMI 366227]